MLYTVSSLIVLYILGLIAPWWVFLVGTFLVALFHRAFVPLLIAVIIDAQFALIDGWVPWYIAGAVVVVGLAYSVRPYVYVRRNV